MAWGEKMRRLFRDRRGSSSRRNPSLRSLLREGDSSPLGEEDLPDPGLPVEQSSGNSDQVDKEEDWLEPEVHAEDPSGKSDLVVVESPGNSNQHVDEPPKSLAADEPDGTAPNKTIQLLAAPTDDQDLWKGTHDINARGVAGDSDFVHHPLSYTWGIHNTNLFFMAVGLLVLVMMIRSTEPPIDSDAIWKNSLNLGYGFVILTLCLSRTLGSAVALVLAISYGPFIAGAVHSHSGPIFGRAAIHLTTAWAAGCFGYSMAIYRLSVGSLQVDRVAHIEWYSRRSKEQNGILDVYCCLMVTIPTLFLVIPVIWIIKNMMWMKANDFVLALTALTMITTVLLYLWSIPLVFKTAIVSVDTMFRLMVVFLASFAPSFVVAIFGRVLLLNYFSVLMMMMAVMFGYVLAANQHRKCSASMLLLEVKDDNGEARTRSTLS